MPANAVTVTANFQAHPTYSVTVIAGTGASGGGNYAAGATVNISAGTAPSGQKFKNWTVTSGGVTLSNANSSTTSFTMPANAVTVTANFEATTPVTPPSGSFTETVNGYEFYMVSVAGGTFTMGCTSEQGSDCDDDEQPTHSVTVGNFHIGEHEVTQKLWKEVVGSLPSSLTSSSSYGYGDEYPVYYVSWNDIQNTFIPKLNEKTGKKYRLPTEAEWEYAARGGNQSGGYKYSGSNTLGDVGWYWDNSSSGTKPVGTKLPNALGIYDMSGNVWEWVSDWYGDYSSTAQTDPAGPLSGSIRVRRGGSWNFDAGDCRVSFRYGTHPDGRSFNLGFRLVLSP
jgi:formylglycine-generating enzyme required for sulfatase activity